MRFPSSRLPVAAAVMLTWSLGQGTAQTAEEFFNDSVVHEIRLRVRPGDWQRLKEHSEENTYYPCDFTWRGITVREIGIRSRGHGSRSGIKPGVRVDFNRIQPNQEFLGLKSVELKNLAQDASMLKDRLSMLLFRRMGLPAPREAHTRLYVNGEYVGVYGIVESMDKRFLKRQFGEDDGYLYKYELSEPYHFEYRGSDPSRYSPLPFEPHTHEKEPNPAPLVAMIRTMNQSSDADFPRAMAQYLDLKGFVTHLAVENFLTETDGILGVGGMNNFFLYRFEGKNLSEFIPWDKDGTMTAEIWNHYAAWSQWPIWANVNENVLARRALAVPELRHAYLEALLKCAALAGEAGGWLEWEITREYNQIRTAAGEDRFKLCRNEQGVMRPCSNDAFEQDVAGLRQFARERSDYVRREVAAAGFQFSDAAPRLGESGAVNAASALPVLAPGALASVYGEGMGNSLDQAASLPLPTALAGVSIIINGFPAPLLFVSPTQVNLQVPWEVAPGSAPVTAIVNGVLGNTFMAEIRVVSPGIFAVLHEYGSEVSIDQPAEGGDVLVVYATGLGPVTQNVSSGRPALAAPLASTVEIPTVTVGREAAEVLFSGLAPGFVGLYQLNVRMPAGLAGSKEAAPLVLSIGGQTAPAKVIATR